MDIITITIDWASCVSY